MFDSEKWIDILKYCLEYNDRYIVFNGKIDKNIENIIKYGKEIEKKEWSIEVDILGLLADILEIIIK